MRRNLIVGVAVPLGIAAGLGGLWVAQDQGWLGSKAQRLLTKAAKEQEQGNLAPAQAHLEELIATFPDSSWTDDALLRLGRVYEAEQQLVEARRMYQTLLEKFPQSALVSETQSQLGNVNIALLLSPTVTDLDAVYEVKPGDTLGKIAEASGTTVELLKKANGLKGSVIRTGQKLKVPKGRFSVVVNKTHNQLLLTQDNRFVKSYPVATGKDNSTPEGTFKIVTKVPNPVWYKQGAVVPADSPENILGTRWMGIDKPGYGIHGSVDPTVIGKQVTAGCVRMNNHDVEELFGIVPLGTDVTVVN